MCEIMAIAAAAAFASLAHRARRAGRPSQALGSTALVFTGAALMWGVDCARSFAEGEGLLDMSAGDAMLGALVLAAGLELFAVLRIREGRCCAKTAR